VIFDFILTAVTSVVTFLLGLIPSFGLPAWLGPGSILVTKATDLGNSAAGLGAWVPLGAVVTVLEAIVVAIPIALAVRLGRKVIPWL
jgi:hypothetical protein